MPERMLTRLCFVTLAVIAACTQPTSRVQETRGTNSDSSVVVALAGPPFKLIAFGTRSFPDVPFRIGAALLQNDTVARIIVAALDSQGVRRAYDAQVSASGCGDPEPSLPTVDRLTIGNRLLLRVQIEVSEPGCSGVAAADIRTVHLLDTSRGFREVLSYQSDSLDYGNPEDGPRRAPAYHHAHVYPNNCISTCSILSIIDISSDKRFKQRVFSYHWNADSSALVPGSLQPTSHN